MGMRETPQLFTHLCGTQVLLKTMLILWNQTNATILVVKLHLVRVWDKLLQGLHLLIDPISSSLQNRQPAHKFLRRAYLSSSKFWHLNGRPSKHEHWVEAYSFREVVDFSSPTSLCSASPPWRRLLLLLQVHWLFFTLLLYNNTLAEKLQVRTCEDCSARNKE